MAERTEFVVCAAETLPFPDRSFDSASAVAVLEHLDDDAAAARELARVVAPSGRVWATVPTHTCRCFRRSGPCTRCTTAG